MNLVTNHDPLPLSPADYLEETEHLSCPEFGAYMRLLASYWANEVPPPDCDIALATFSGCTPEEWQQVRPIVAQFFRIEHHDWRHERVDQELRRRAERLAARN